MSEIGMQKLAELMQANPKLQQAALSGLSQALTNEIQSQGLTNQLDASTLAEIGKIGAAPGALTSGNGGEVASDWVASAVSSVLHVVKVGVAELAENLTQMATLQNKVSTQLDSLRISPGAMLNRRL